MNNSVFYLYDGELVDTGYGYANNKGIEVCTDGELEEFDDP